MWELACKALEFRVWGFRVLGFLGLRAWGSQVQSCLDHAHSIESNPELHTLNHLNTFLQHGLMGLLELCALNDSLALALQNIEVVSDWWWWWWWWW